MAKTTATTKLVTASVLAFERKLDPSDGMLFSGNWAERSKDSSWQAIKVNEKSVRGTISNRLGKKDLDPAKLDAKMQVPNLQTVDVAMLDHQHDTVRLDFSLRILGGVGAPSACNNTSYQEKLAATLDDFKKELGFSELASRYAENIANARYLWRNRIGAQQVETVVRHVVRGKTINTFTFDSSSMDLNGFTASSKVKELAKVIEDALAGDSAELLEVEAFANLGKGQEVYPSQELILDKGSAKGAKSKTLYSVNGTAAIHSQKIGNALRTIDTWYPTDEIAFPIAIEPYGSVTTRGAAFRQPSDKLDFYTLLDSWLLKDQRPAPEQQQYVIATLIRGGVFGDADK